MLPPGPRGSDKRTWYAQRGGLLSRVPMERDQVLCVGWSAHPAQSEETGVRNRRIRGGVEQRLRMGTSRTVLRAHQHDTWHSTLPQPKADQESTIVDKPQGLNDRFSSAYIGALASFVELQRI